MPLSLPVLFVESLKPPQIKNRLFILFRLLSEVFRCEASFELGLELIHPPIFCRRMILQNRELLVVLISWASLLHETRTLKDHESIMC